jgi:hypothetical protein
MELVTMTTRRIYLLGIGTFLLLLLLLGLGVDPLLLPIAIHFALFPFVFGLGVVIFVGGNVPLTRKKVLQGAAARWAGLFLIIWYFALTALVAWFAPS